MRYNFDGVIFYPVYHSVHDTYKWLQGFIDPEFEYHLSTTRLAARLLMSSGDKFVLPFDVSKYATALEESLETLKDNHGAELRRNNVTLNFIESAIKEFGRAAAKFKKENESAMDEKSDIKLRDFNDRMVNVEKAFIYPYGLPNQPYTRHLVFAPSLNNRYGTTSFPGISDLMFSENKTSENWEQINREVSVVFKAISEATRTLLPDSN